MSKEDAILNKTKTWVKVGGLISGGLVTILTPLIIMYVEVKPQVDEAQAGAESSIDGIIPAIVEMQGILDDNNDWANEINEDLDRTMDNVDSMERRLVRCEAYMDILSERRTFPDVPDVIEEDPTMKSGFTGPERDTSRMVQQKPQYQIPKDFSKAKELGKSRQAAKCSADDPLCGGI